jgi:lipopolysaccharide export LptBFGC system permease protein LptF
LVEKILKIKDVLSAESRLIEFGITKYVDEEQVVKFYKQTNKDNNLKLTYIENYIRIIPTKIIELKNKADELKIFDNYVILHYDPQNNSTNLTEKEIAKAKDPIMFGVIRQSRKLYFIGDWVDPYCNLTLDKMMKEIKDKKHILTNDSVISYIDSI